MSIFVNYTNGTVQTRTQDLQTLYCLMHQAPILCFLQQPKKVIRVAPIPPPCLAQSSRIMRVIP